MAKFHWMWAVYGLAAVLVGGALAFKVFQPIQVLPRMRPAPAFSMVDQHGQRLTNEDLRGQFVIYTFFYSDCLPRCEAPFETLLAVQRRLSEVNLGSVPLTIVAVSFDPQADTAAVLQAFAARLGPGAANWRFATITDPVRLKTVVGAGFRVYYEPAAQAGFRFDPRLVLVDGWGVIRGEYKYQAQASDADRLVRHLGVLADEVRNSDGPNRLAYEAAHYFLCYAP
jgi:protein SCO1/2